MPIVWKTSFEDPLILLMKSGQLGNSSKLINAIVNLYDLSIKQGLPNTPGTPAGPVLAGNRAALEAALRAFFISEAIQAQAGIIKNYATIVTGIVATIKETNKEILSYSKQLNRATRDQIKTANQIQRLSRLNTQESKKQIAVLKVKNAQNFTIIKDAKNLLVSKKEYLINQIRPQIKKIIDLLKKLVIKILAPPLQDTVLKSIVALPKLIKETVTDLKNKKKEFLDEIKNNVTKVRTGAETLKTVQRMVSKEDANLLKGTIVSFIKTSNAGEMVKKGKQITNIVDKYPNSRIPLATKDSVRKAITTTIQAKTQIISKKEYAREFLLEKLKEKKDSLLGTFKPKIGPGLTSAQEIKADALEIKQTVQNYKNIIKENSQVASLLIQIKQEIKIINNPTLKNYKPNIKLAAALDKYTPGLGTKYSAIRNPREAKTFIYSNTALFNAKKDELLNKKEIAKGYVNAVKKKILDKKFNIKEIKFNIFLRIGVLGYFAGAITPNLGIVTFPGVLTLPVSMKPSADPANFVRSLSRTLQLHTKTIAGTYTIPGTPPVVLPWVGYS